MAEIDFSKFNPVPAHRATVILTGRRFEKFTVVSYFGLNPFHKTLWLCRCDCGVFRVFIASQLLSGRNLRTCYTRVPGTHKSPEYRAYVAAKGRCNNRNSADYPEYGGRGIEFRFCSFQTFLRAMGKRPGPNYSVDRIDVNGHYEPGNVRWATEKEQAGNKRTNHRITVGRTTHIAEDWANALGITRSTFASRLNKLGWCNHCAITIKPGLRKTCPHRTATSRSISPSR